jgi:hypothetical protein
VAESRGRDNTEDELMDEGAMSTLFSCSISVGIARGKGESGRATGVSEGRDGKGLGSAGEGDGCEGGSSTEGGGMCKEL